jgi:hypothetical protein
MRAAEVREGEIGTWRCAMQNSWLTTFYNTRCMTVSQEYRGRRAAIVENHDIRLTVLEEGGRHIADIPDKRFGSTVMTRRGHRLSRRLLAAKHPSGRRLRCELLAGIAETTSASIFSGSLRKRWRPPD